MTRKSWDEYFLDIAEQVSARSTCNRLHVGCVIVKDKHIIATGYNGSIHGHDHCEDAGCLLGDDNRCHRTIHAKTAPKSWPRLASSELSTAMPTQTNGTGTFSRIWKSSTCRRNRCRVIDARG